jgi:hypothetical protein
VKSVPFTARRVDGDARMLTIELPRSVAAMLAPIIERSEARHGGFLALSVGLPHAARSTGEKSQNHAIHGIMTALWDQSGARETMGYEAFRLWLKWRAIPTWPYDAAPDGAMIPRSETDLSMDEARACIDWLRMFAADNGVEVEGFDD